MARSIESLKNRINLLSARDPVANANLIRKAKRQIRKLEAKQES